MWLYGVQGLGFRVHLVILEKKMETTIVNCGYIGIMKKKMETTVYWGFK